VRAEVDPRADAGDAHDALDCQVVARENDDVGFMRESANEPLESSVREVGISCKRRCCSRVSVRTHELADAM
jgi:hypothetical protein